MPDVIVVTPPDNQVIVSPMNDRLFPTGIPGPAGSGGVDNTIPRFYSYNNGQLNFPSTPQAYPMIWMDCNDPPVPWICEANSTKWVQCNTVLGAA